VVIEDGQPNTFLTINRLHVLGMHSRKKYSLGGRVANIKSRNIQMVGWQA